MTEWGGVRNENLGGMMLTFFRDSSATESTHLNFFLLPR